MSEGSAGRALMRAGLVGAAVATATLATRQVLAGRPPGGPDRWSRQNYRQRTVDLFGGPAAATGALATTIGVRAAGLPVGQTAALAAAVGSTAALGAYDDLAGVTHARGLRGHVAALRRGELTTGVVKMAGMTVAGALAAPPRRRSSARLVDTALIAGAANLVNLLDLRPGRALKVVAIVGLPMMVGRDPGATGAVGAVATAAALMPGDLAEEHMLGDCGANALGALLGWALAVRSGTATRAIALGGVVGLTLLSERVSFSAVIDGNPALAAVDAWGRQPA